MHNVLLHKRVIVSDALVFDAEREVSLPLAPFVGLCLYNTESRPPDGDESEDWIEEIAWDLKTGRVICYLRDDDYRAASSGSLSWTEKEVRRRLQGWSLTPDASV